MSDADRITDLEIMAAHQAQAIEDLSGELRAQWQRIAKLETTLKALGERFLALEEATLPRPEATKPPHY